MILTCGEALFDVFVEAGDGLRREAVFAMGGSPCNVAVALARQSVAAGFFGGLSSGPFGVMLRSILDAEGVSHTLSPPLPFKTTLSIVSRDANGHPSYDFRGAQGADIMFDVAQMPDALPLAVKAVALSSYPLVVDPVRHTMLAMAQLAARDRLVSIDVNYRAALVGDPTRWAERFAPYETLATIMKASAEDIALAYGAERTIEDAASHWLAQGAALVLITRGAEGASAFRADQRIDVDAPPIDLVDSVGAGDCFHAGFLAALARQDALSRNAIRSLSRDSLRSALIWAVTTASLNVGRRGTDPPRPAEIEAALSASAPRLTV